MSDRKTDMVAVQQRWPRQTRDRLRNLVGAKSMAVSTLEAIEKWMDEHEEQIRADRRAKRAAERGKTTTVVEESQEQSLSQKQSDARVKESQRQSSERGGESTEPVSQPLSVVMPDTPESVEAKMKQAMGVARMAQESLRVEQRVQSDGGEASDAADGSAEQRVKSGGGEAAVSADAEQRVSRRIPEAQFSADAKEEPGTVESAHVVGSSPFGGSTTGWSSANDVRQAVLDRKCPADGGPVLVRTKTKDGKKVLVSVNCRTCDWAWPVA